MSSSLDQSMFENPSAGPPVAAGLQGLFVGAWAPDLVAEQAAR